MGRDLRPNVLAASRCASVSKLVRVLVVVLRLWRTAH